MNRKKILISAGVVGALALLLVSGIFAYHSVYAQTATPTGNNDNPPSGWKGGPMNGFMGGRTSYSDQDLADALGITTDQLQAAYQTADTKALADAVSQGLITQDQADQRSANGDKGGRFGRFNLQGIDYNTYLADALGITSDQLQTAIQQAQTTFQANQGQNGSPSQDQLDLMQARQALSNDATFQSSLKSAYEAAVNQAVTDGTITQDQADQLLSNDSNMNFLGMGPGGDHGGFGGRFPQGAAPDTTSTPPADSGL